MRRFRGDMGAAARELGRLGQGACGVGRREEGGAGRAGGAVLGHGFEWERLAGPAACMGQSEVSGPRSG